MARNAGLFTSGEIDLTYGKQDQTWVDRMKKEKDTVVEVFDPGAGTMTAGLPLVAAARRKSGAKAIA